jgi:hypothetical protein
MHKACSDCGATTFKIVDNVLMCINNHEMHVWKGNTLMKIMVY